MTQRRKLNAAPGTPDRWTYLGLGVSSTGQIQLTKHASARYVWVHPTLGSDSYTGLDAVHTTGVTGPKATLQAGWDALRGEFGDWLLLPSGLSFTEGFGAVYGRSGLNASYPVVVTTYDPADPTNAALYRTGRVTIATAPTVSTQWNGTVSPPTRYRNDFCVFENMDIAKAAVSDYAFSIFGLGDGVLFENCRFTRTPLSYLGSSALSVTNTCLRRCSFYKAVLSTGAGQGFYADEVDGLVIEDSVLHHNGWTAAARDDAVASGSEPDIFKHNVYLATRTANVVVRRTVSGYASSHGFQLRGGANVRDVVCIKNPINMLGGLGDDYDVYQPSGVLFDVSRVTISGSSDIDSVLARGFGFVVGNTTAASQITDSIVAIVSAAATSNIIPLTLQADFAQPSILTYTNNIQFDWGGNAYAASGSQPGQCSITRNFNRWSNEAASGTNTVCVSGDFPDATRSAETYAVAQGYTDSEDMLDAAILDPWQDWAVNIGAYIRSGFGR